MHYLLLASFLWGTSFIAGKYAYFMVDPVLLVQMRLIIASVFVLPILIRKKSMLSKINFVTWMKLFWISFLIYPVTFLLQFIGLKYTTASSAATMLGVSPLAVVLVGFLFFKEAMKKQDLILSIVSLVGVFLVVGITSENNEISLFGCGLNLLSTIIVGFWVMLSKNILNDINTEIFTAVTLLVGCLGCLPFTLLFSDCKFQNPNFTSIFALIYLGLGCSLIASWLWNKGLSIFRTNTSGLFLALEPVFGVIFSIILLNERLSITTFIGILLVFFASFAYFIIPIFNKK